MFRKLIKHEFKSTYSIFVQMIVGLFIMTFITMLMMNFVSKRSAVTYSYGFVDGAFAFSFGLWILSLITVIIAGFILIIRRFYVSMVGKGAYLSYTLPVSTSSLVGAKFLVALIWKILINVAVFVSVLFIVYSMLKNNSDFNLNFEKIEEGIVLFNREYPEEYRALTHMFLMFPIVSLIYEIFGIVSWYFASVIGMQARKYKIGTMILSIIAISFIMQTVASLFLVNESLNWLVVFQREGSNMDSFHHIIDFQTSMMLKSAFISLVMAVICFIGTCLIVKKKPNIT